MSSGDPGELLIVENAISLEYRKVLEDLQAQGKCPLDIEEYLKLQPENLLRQLGGWVLGKSTKPYENTEQVKEEVTGHMILFPERHITKLVEMTKADKMAFWDLLKIAQNDFGAEGAGLGMRFGNQRIAGGT